jgi:hypothetical protein
MGKALVCCLPRLSNVSADGAFGLFGRVMLCFPIEIFCLLFAHLWVDEMLFSFSNIFERLDRSFLSHNSGIDEH